MTLLRQKFVCSTVAALALLGIAGCGDGGGKGASDAGVCTAGTAMGTLTVKVVGLPGNAGAVTVSNADDSHSVAVTTDLSLAAGAYTVTATRVAEADPIVRTAYEPSVSVSNPCVTATQTTIVTVTYTAIPTSGHLWAGNAQKEAALLGFTSASLTTTGTPAAAVAAITAGSAGFTFDKAGNVWVIGGTTADPPVARYPAAMFATSGTKTPDVTLSSPSFGDGIPGPKVLTFDSTGNLWVSVVAGNKLVRFTPAQLMASGSPTAAVEMSGISAPAGVAFDAAGNLWAASGDQAKVVRIDAAHLSASRDSVDFELTAKTPPPVIGDLSSPAGLAFDASGNLWVNYDGALARFTATDLAGTGPKSVTPSVQVTADVLSLPVGIAFDEGGGLWLAYSAGKFARFAPGQLLTSGSVPPQTIISSPSVGYAEWFALYPAPAATPLAHRLP